MGAAVSVQGVAGNRRALAPAGAALAVAWVFRRRQRAAEVSAICVGRSARVSVARGRLPTCVGFPRALRRCESTAVPVAASS